MFEKIIKAIDEIIAIGKLTPEEEDELRVEVAELSKFEMEYEYLLEQVEFLNCLEAAGVDNWSGYGDAQQMMEEDE